MSKQHIHMTYSPDTMSLYLADGDAGKWTLLQGEKAELIHRIIQQEIENPPWADAQSAEHLNVNQTANARIPEAGTRCKPNGR